MPLESLEQRPITELQQNNIPQKSASKFQTGFWILALLICSALINLTLFGWGINRGLDIKDESFMLTCYRYPHLYQGFTTYFHFIVSRMFGAFDFGLLQYRIAGFSMKLFATVVFAWGFWRWLKNDESEKG